MALPGYGLLIGRLTGWRPQQGASPHLLLFVKPGVVGHPSYRVAVNLQSDVPGGGGGLQYQVVDLTKGGDAAKALVKELRKRAPTINFLRADSDSEVPRLDFVRDHILDARAFKTDAHSAHARSVLEHAIAAAASAGDHDETYVAVFGTGYPIDTRTGTAPGTGFTGVENIHMNQGSRHVVGDIDYYRENGPRQDGGLIFLTRTGATGFFVKFPDQTVNTDDQGLPNETGIDALDRTPPDVRDAMMPPRRPAPPGGEAGHATHAARKTATSHAARPASPPVVTHASVQEAPGRGAAPGAPVGPSTFVFADPNPDDAKTAYLADDDSGNRTAPQTVKLGRGTTRGPVPSPRGYPVLALSDVVGNSPAGYTKTADAESISFDLVGDSGAPSAKKLPGELSVTSLMVRDAASSPPAFLFHLGDVVYFYGEKDYYYSQFYEPFQAYPAPIFAIPGNHDGITYGPDMVSLDAFEKAFCAVAPGRWEGSAGILRSTMIQPGVYFTLDAPLVSIIGLYSNCGESLGWLDSQQLLFLYNELVRLKKLRQQEGRAVILAIHHCPRWFPGQSAKDPTSDAIDQACNKAGFWPDAVVCGHAHLYQRIVRQDGGRDVPYIISGAGGYGINPEQVTAKAYAATLAPRLTRLLLEEGYVRATVTRKTGSKPGTLRLEYRSVKQTTDEPDDVCVIDLAQSKLL
jgi:uncharacterized protein YukJ